MRARRYSGSITGYGQGGIALLVFMLVLLVGSSYVLLSKLNEYAQTYARDAQTRIALLKAKRALLNYAMNYPELKSASNTTVRGPGYLPCPDENGDGVEESNCSVTTGSTLGRLPTQTLGLSDLRDSSGERLWYAVSQNFKYNQPTDYVLNSETPGTISVDGTGDIVAVIIAPGPPVTGQTGRATAEEAVKAGTSDLYQEAGQYLEDDNATTGDASYVTSSSSGNEFNDQLVTITRAELMQYVQKRVLSEAGKALASYQNSAGNYPWLAPFGDPKADARWVKGYVSSSGAGDLVDSSADFSAWGINTGDVVWNITQGSVGAVSGTPSTTDIPVSGMSFDANDEYLVEPSGLAEVLADGTATSASSGTTLEDTSKDFDAPLVAPGDIIDDVTDDSSGRVASVDNDTLTVDKLSGGTNNAFTPGDRYRIRSNAGTATSGSSGTTLEDTGADFQTMNVQAGALVRDLTDGSFGEVASVTGAHTLTVTSLNMGTNDSFASGDHYVISRYDPVSSTTEGMLPIQEPGQAFATGFTVDWALSSSSYIDVTSGLDSTYSASIKSLVQKSTNNSSTLSVSSSDGRCIWVAQSIADCKGIISDPNFLSGTSMYTSSNYVYDSSQDFAGEGVKPGDRVENTTTGRYGVVTYTWPSSYPGWLYANNISGYSSFSISTGDTYRVSVATKDFYGSTSCGYGFTGTTKVYTSTNLSNVSAGDVVSDTNDGTYGLITGVGGPVTLSSWNCSGTYYWFTYTKPVDTGGSMSYIGTGDTYRIYYNYVDKRDFEFQVRTKMQYTDAANLSAAISSTSGIRTRSVCVGYNDGSGCGTVSTTTTSFPYNAIAPQISLLDYDSSNNLVGSATAANSSSATGSLRISGISYSLGADDFPDWFVKNRWQQFLYAAYSSPYEPGGAGGPCTAGTDCLKVNVQTPPSTLDSVQSLVLAAGKQLDSQDRTSGALDAYFESDNATTSSPPEFDKYETTSDFNDQLLIICPNNSPRPSYTCP